MRPTGLQVCACAAELIATIIASPLKAPFMATIYAGIVKIRHLFMVNAHVHSRVPTLGGRALGSVTGDGGLLRHTCRSQ
jgi:hypothetical protein